jgi:hypothetical protein
MSQTVVFQTRMVPSRFIVLPFERRATGIDVSLGRAAKVGDVFESGTVEISESLLYDVNDRDIDDYLVGNIPTFHISSEQTWALEQAGWAVRETRGGVHGTDALTEFLDS